MSLLRRLFGSKPARGARAPARATTSLTGKTDQAQVIAEAMAVHRRERAQMRAGLDAALARLRDEAPKALRNPEALTRLLSLHRAHLELRRLMASDHKRFLVLTGMRELLGEEAGEPAKALKK